MQRLAGNGAAQHADVGGVVVGIVRGVCGELMLLLHGAASTIDFLGIRHAGRASSLAAKHVLLLRMAGRGNRLPIDSVAWARLGPRAAAEAAAVRHQRSDDESCCAPSSSPDAANATVWDPSGAHMHPANGVESCRRR